eukprot:4656650-Lingulodinium_polyedra.AAC.1
MCWARCAGATAPLSRSCAGSRWHLAGLSCKRPWTPGSRRSPRTPRSQHAPRALCCPGRSAACSR